MQCYLFPDTTVMINFAVVDRLDLLRAYLGTRARAVEAVAYEVRRSAERTPHLGTVDFMEWFGEPITLDAPADVSAVRILRTSRFGGRTSEPLQHLGESQTLHVISTFPEFSGSVLISDDVAAYDYAVKIGVLARCTVDILEHLVVDGSITAGEAFDLAEAMANTERSLIHAPLSKAHFT
jgi:hypothetical protein